MSGRQHTQRLPLNDSSREELLDRLDHPVEDARRYASRVNRRNSARLPYRHNDVAMTVEHVGGTISRLLICSRNLSEGGLGFLHGGFLHPGSRCHLRLVRLDGQPVVLHGYIATVRHVAGAVHELGVRFDAQIRLADFVDDQERDAVPAQPALDVPEVNARVLIVEDSASDAILLSHFLAPTGAAISQVTTPGAAIDAVKRSAFDMIFTELNLDEEDGVRAIDKVRAAGFCGQIAIVTADQDARRLEAARALGVSEVLMKPYSPADLYKVLQSMTLLMCGSAEQSLTSSLAGQVAMHPLIDRFVLEARELADRIETALDAGRLHVVRKTCVKLTGSAASFGFNGLGNAAKTAVQMIDDRAGADVLAMHVRRVVQTARNILPPRTASNEGDCRSRIA